VTGHDYVGRFCISGNRCLYRAGTISGGNSGGNAGGGLDRNREIATEWLCAALHHQWQVELTAAVLRQCKADQAAGVRCHEVDIRRSNLVSRDHQIAFVLAIFVVHQNDDLALAEVVDDVGDVVECHE